MICKKDVILWFKELESYKRIDTMCTLLNMCLPFELRFLGTCLEELGRRDSQELRGMELRVNNPQDLSADIVSCQKGEPTDKKIRRKMALYLALIRACNRTCVAEIFRTLDGWGERDFFSMTDLDTLQELLLVYTMASNHPVFSFEQHMKCTEIFEKIKENKLVCDQQPLPPTQQQHVEQHAMSSIGGQHQQDLRQHLPPSQQELLQQHAMHAMHLAGQHPQMMAGGIQVLSQGSIAMNFPPAHLAKLIPTDGNLQHPIAVDSMPHMISSNITIPADSNAVLAHPNATWPMRPFAPQSQSIENPPQSSSPMLSQQSSPSSSRTTSPNRTPSGNMIQSGMQAQMGPGRNISQRIATMKGIRRPSTETTPPPMNQQQQQQQHQQQLPHVQMMNEMILPQNIKHMDDVLMNNEVSGNQLQSLIRNGFPRTAHHPRLKAGNYVSAHQQQQQSPVNQHFQSLPAGNFAVNAGLVYTMQNMSMAADGMGGGIHNSMDSGHMGMHSNKSAGSDSGSSIGSPGDISPSETPTLLANAPANALRMGSDLQHMQQKHHQPLSYNKQMNLMRLNGRSDKLLPVSTGSSIMYAPSSMVTNAHQPLSQQQSQQLFGNADMLHVAGGNTGALVNNNNSGSSMGVPNTNANVVSSNNNMTSNTVLMSSPSGSGILGNMITSNSMILGSPQQQYNTSYPYHAAAAAAAQHLASASRPPLMTHNPGMAPPGTFRLPGFQLPPNGELLYPAYHPAGITFLPSGAPPGATPVTLRSNSATVSSSATAGVPPSQLTQQQQPPQQLQPTQAGVPNTSLLSASPYSTLTVGVSAKLSCYNCGSQTHSGRDCQEASMDDVTRTTAYKLDYSLSASSNASPTTGSGTNLPMGIGGVGSGGGSDAQTSHHHQKQHSMDSGTTAPSTATLTSTSVMTSAAAGVMNTK